jgi:hypothetical protein
VEFSVLLSALLSCWRTWTAFRVSGIRCAAHGTGSAPKASTRHCVRSTRLAPSLARFWAHLIRRFSRRGGIRVLASWLRLIGSDA